MDLIWVAVPVVMISGIVRGFTGFGFAAIAVVGLNLFWSPQISIPLVLGLDVICSAGLWRQARQQGDIVTLKWLIVGALVGIPIGLLSLFFVPDTILKLLICIMILVLTLLLAFSFQLNKNDSKGSKLSFGIASGIGTAAASVGGPMIVCYMLSSQLSAAAQRATMILFFIISESVAIAAMAGSGLFQSQTLILLAMLLPVTFVAVRIGQWLYNYFQPESLKTVALPIMALAAFTGLIASIGQL